MNKSTRPTPAEPLRKIGKALALLACLCAPVADAPQARADDAHATAPLWQCEGVLVRISGPSSAPVGSEARYQIAVSNDGTCNLTSAQLTYYLPLETIYRSAAPTPSIHPQAPGPEFLDSLSTPPIDQVQWADLHLAASGFIALYEATVQVQGPAGRTMTGTACFEHPETGRICDALDTYVTAGTP